MNKLINNHNGRGVFTQIIYEVYNLVLHHNTPRNPLPTNKIQNSTGSSRIVNQLLQLIRTDNDSWRFFSLNYYLHREQ